LLSKHSYKFREGIDQTLPAFADYSSSIQMQGHLMSVTQHSATVQGDASDPKHVTDPSPSIYCALLLFVAAVSSFIGAALLLASIWEGGAREHSFEPRQCLLVLPEVKMHNKVELVARAIHKSEHQELSWDSEPSARKECFREYARNAINLLGEDIGVLLLALEEATAGKRIGHPRAAA
jgi:hypothetical protein